MPNPTRSSATSTSNGLPRGARRLPIIGYIGLVVVYLLVIQGIERLVEKKGDTGYAAFTTTEQVLRHLVLPVGLSFVLVHGAVAALG